MSEDRLFERVFFSSKEKLHISLRLGDINDHTPRNPPGLLIENFDKDY